MAFAIPFSLTDAALGPAMSLIVVDRDGVQYEVKTAGEAARYLAEAWSGTLEALGDRALVPYTPEVVIRSGEKRALVITDDLREENEVVEELLEDGDRPQIKPSEVGGELYLYAVVSNTKAGRTAMIKKKNPTKRARAGKALFAAPGTSCANSTRIPGNSTRSSTSLSARAAVTHSTRISSSSSSLMPSGYARRSDRGSQISPSSYP